MVLDRERGSSILEVTIAVAIVAIVVIAVMNAMTAAMHRFGQDPTQLALEGAAEREMRVAVNVLKYRGTVIAPNAISTSLPLPSASPFPARLSIQTIPLAGDGVQITIVASSQTPARAATLITAIAHRAPAPGTVILAPQSVAQPTGAP